MEFQNTHRQVYIRLNLQVVDLRAKIFQQKIRFCTMENYSIPFHLPFKGLFSNKMDSARADFGKHALCSLGYRQDKMEKRILFLLNVTQTFATEMQCRVNFVEVLSFHSFQIANVCVSFRDHSEQGQQKSVGHIERKPNRSYFLLALTRMPGHQRPGRLVVLGFKK